MKNDKVYKKLEKNWKSLNESVKDEYGSLLKKAYSSQGTTWHNDVDPYNGRGEVPGLEGPFKSRTGFVYYYDPKEGKYYDPARDMYIDYEDHATYGIN